MTKSQYIHIGVDKAYEDYKNEFTFQKDVEQVYNDITIKIKQPDLLGKTVKVTEKQFSQIYNMIYIMSEAEQIEMPNVYIFEDYYYGIESYGIEKPWIEVSAKTIQDFTNKELEFIFAREIFKIKDGVTKQQTITNQMLHIYSNVPVIGNSIENITNAKFLHWYRLANYTADNYGYAVCKDIKASVYAILKMVLNSIKLVEQLDIRSFIRQASNINKLDDEVYNYTKADENMPYAPMRIESLLSYAVSARGLNVITEGVCK